MKTFQVTVFEPGDIVSLKSGGPKMTVAHLVIGDDSGAFDEAGISSVHCEWFTDGALSNEDFLSSSLTLAMDA